MIYVEVMYSDQIDGKFRQVRVPVEDVETLDTDNVLYIILSTETSPDRALGTREDGKYYRRRIIGSGEDYYGVWDDGEKVTLLQWSMHEFRYVSKANPTGNSLIKTKEPPYKPPGMTVFTGVQVTDSEWKEATQQFEKEMF